VKLSAFFDAAVIWGTNWPVAKPADAIAEQVPIADNYLATKTQARRDKVMFKNAILFFRRVQ
jgi:predicted TIM-barrel fold metal-dependent hydrolase